MQGASWIHASQPSLVRQASDPGRHRQLPRQPREDRARARGQRHEGVLGLRARRLGGRLEAGVSATQDLRLVSAEEGAERRVPRVRRPHEAPARGPQARTGGLPRLLAGGLLRGARAPARRGALDEGGLQVKASHVVMLYAEFKRVGLDDLCASASASRVIGVSVAAVRRVVESKVPAARTVHAWNSFAVNERCSRGHSLTQENVYRNEKSGKAQCRECQRVREKARVLTPEQAEKRRLKQRDYQRRRRESESERIRQRDYQRNRRAV
jgi:hypothetical protein